MKMIQKTEYDYSGWTATDLVERFGSIPITRICVDPPPGTATEQDVVAIHDATSRLFELVDGTLLEKTMGTFESYLAIQIAMLMGTFVKEHKLGIILGEAGMMRFSPGLIRIPDVSFISKKRLPNGLDPNEAVATIVPNLAVEVISQGNTDREMERKLEEYFQFGVELVWYVYPQDKSVVFYTSATESNVETKVVNGGNVLPNFKLSIEELFKKPF